MSTRCPNGHESENPAVPGHRGAGCRFPNFVSPSQFLCHPDVRNDTKVRLMQPSPTSGDMRTRRHNSSSMNLVVENDEASEKDHKQIERPSTKCCRAIRLAAACLPSTWQVLRRR